MELLDLSNVNIEYSTIKDTPFYDKEKDLFIFPYRPTYNRVFVWPYPLPKKYDDSSIEIPEQYRDQYRNEFGVVLAISKLWIDNKGKKHPHRCKVGDFVFYDKNVIYEQKFKGVDGKDHLIKTVGNYDVRGIISKD